MDRNEIKSLAKKAKATAEEGAKKVEVVAKKVVAGVGDGIDSAKENQKKSALAKNALKELRDGIKTLESDNKIKTEGNIKEETKAIVEDLKNLSQIVKNNPEKCDEEIESYISKYRALKGSLLENGVAGQGMLSIQVMSKRYDEALKTCLRTKAAIGDAKNNASEGK